VIAFAQTGNRADVLATFNAVQSTETSEASLFAASLKTFVTAQVNALPGKFPQVRLEVRTGIFSLSNWHTEITVQPWPATSELSM